MENFSLQDLVIILGSVSLFAAACIVMPPLFRYAPRFFSSAFRRYLTFDFDDIMSRIADLGDATDARSGARGDATDAPIVLLGHTHQVNDENNSENASGGESLVLRQLPKTELIAMLAVQRKEDGSYLWSSNEIKKFIPGSDGPIGEIIATVRGKKAPDPPARAIRRTPSGDWEPAK